MLPNSSHYAPRVPIFPKRVSGRFRTLKWWILIVTLTIYYVTPWLRWDRGPNLPDQAVLVDIAGRRFYFLWIEIWPHEFYFVAGLLIMAGLGLFLFTAAFGRVWCGYACPQTVWTDLFILVERWIEGDRNARLRLHNGTWDFRKWRLRLAKWTTWLIIALLTGGAWVFYFADAPTLLVELVTFEAHYVAYATIGFLTATTFIFGGFMREQVCNYMCPWPRIQAAMMDPKTITVAYREWRGEPRGKMDDDTAGDCIDCMACVNVCPAGIDIRDGQQLECITCALCIDACDDIMEKIGRPRGLIDYLSLADEEAERAGGQPQPVWKHILTPRIGFYAFLWAAVGIGMVYALFIRSDLEMSVTASRSSPYILLSDGTIRNAYEVNVQNKSGEPRLVAFSLTSDQSFTLELETRLDNNTVELPANASLPVRVYVMADPNSQAASADRSDLRLWVEDVSNGERISEAAFFSGRSN